MQTQAVQPLQRIGASDDDAIDIIDAALLIAQADQPKADLFAAQSHVDDLCGEVLSFAARAQNARERATALADVIHGRHGYSGDRLTYDDPDNANLLSVIARRKGLPVSLAILYLGVAHRLGWVAEGLNVPAHFMIRIGDAEDHVLQDPFDDGMLLTPHDIPARLKPLGVTADKLSPALFSALPVRAILVRLVNNLAARAEASGDLARALEMHQRMTLIAPRFTGLWWERARLEREMGQLGAARSSLVQLMETTHDPVLIASVQQAAAQLGRHLN